MIKKDIVKKMIEEAKDSVLKDEIFETYYTQRIIGGQKKFELELGGVQRSLETKRDVIVFLEKYIKDL